MITQPYFILGALADWQRLLLEWFGVRFDDVPSGARAEIVWSNVPSSWGVFVFIILVVGLVYCVFALYRRELACCPPRSKALLAALRSGIVLLLAGIFLGPAVVYVQNRTVKPTIVIARDASQSMNTADSYHEPGAMKGIAQSLGKRESEIAAMRPTRVQIVNELLSSNRLRLLERVASRGRLQAMDFADQATMVEVQHSTRMTRRPGVHDRDSQEHYSIPPVVAEGRSTDLSAAIQKSLAVERPAAIVMFSDGQHTGTIDPRETAREAMSRRVPLLIVGVGNPDRPKNVAVRRVYASPQVWQREPFEIEAVIQFQDIDAGGVRVELVEQKVSEGQVSVGEGRVVSVHDVATPEGGTGQAAVRFSHTAEEPGSYVYRVRAPSTERESEETDNLLSSSLVKVLNRQSVRVLLVAGAPTWDYRLVQRLLARDKTIEVSCWLQTLDEERAQEGTRPIARLPISKGELFYYDVVLLFDPSPEEIDRPWVELLKEFVGEHSGGLLFMAGPKYSGRLLAEARTSEIGKLLPVTFGDVGALEVAALVSGNQRAWPMQLVAANADSPVLRFDSAAEEAKRRWETLPGILWSFPCQGTRPAAQVLVEHTDPTLGGARGARPLLVTGRFGSGRTLYLGFNGTWRWRKAGGQAEFFDKFWIQSIRYLLEGRSLEGRRRGSIATDRDRYELGQRVTLTARLQDTAYEPLVADEVDATVQVAGQPPEIVPLLPVANQPGVFQATFKPRGTGIHQVRVALGVGNSESGQIDGGFGVEMPMIETSQVWLNKLLLKDLATLSGGRYFDVEEVDGIVEAVPDRMETIQTRSQPRPVWDVRGMLVALVGLLCIEWIIRKRLRLL